MLTLPPADTSVASRGAVAEVADESCCAAWTSVERTHQPRTAVRVGADDLRADDRVDETAVSVPLVWFDPPQKVSVVAGDEVSAVGTVRRRFYRAGGATQSRTEVVVHHLGRAGDKRVVAAQRRWIAGLMESEAFDAVPSS